MAVARGRGEITHFFCHPHVYPRMGWTILPLLRKHSHVHNQLSDLQHQLPMSLADPQSDVYLLITALFIVNSFHHSKWVGPKICLRKQGTVQIFSYGTRTSLSQKQYSRPRDMAVSEMAWRSGRTSVFGRRTFPVLRSTCSWRVTTYTIRYGRLTCAQKLTRWPA